MNDIPPRLTAALADRYRLIRPLGAGGMATVYLADDLRHARQVAIKVLRPELAAVIGAERFLAEIRTTANLQHPHILPLFDSGEADGFLFYVMPYVDGETLRDRLDREKQLAVDEAVRIVVAVASALDYAHRQGVIHRDIKPANILIHDGQPMVADFGIALAVSAAGSGRMTETGLSLGTPFYMSPEQASADRELNARSDLYSLACVLYECLAGQPPFTGGSAQAVLMQILTEEARPLTRTRRSVSANVDAAVAKGLEKLPADRFATAADFGAALRDPNFRHGATRPPDSAAPQGSRRSPSALLWPAVALIAVAAGAVGWLRSQPADEEPPLWLSIPVASQPTQVNTAILFPLAVQDDGLGLAYVAQSDEGVYEVRYRRLDQVDETTLLTGEPGSLTFSPDGTYLAVVEGSRLVAVPTAGGPPRILDDDVSDIPLSWTERGIHYLDPQGSLMHRPSLDGPSSVFRARAPTTPWS